MINWNNKVKRILKSELIKRGITNQDLALRLSEIGVFETKASIDSKISRGTFSACFFFQCLTVIGCHKIEIDNLDSVFMLVADPSETYKTTNNEK